MFKHKFKMLSFFDKRPKTIWRNYYYCLKLFDRLLIARIKFSQGYQKLYVWKGKRTHSLISGKEMKQKWQEKLKTKSWGKTKTNFVSDVGVATDK